MTCIIIPKIYTLVENVPAKINICVVEGIKYTTIGMESVEI